MEYGHGATLRDNDAGERRLLAFSAAFMGLIGLALLVGILDVLFLNWPDFGLTLIAVPVGLIGVAFLSIAYTAGRSALRRNGTIDGQTTSTS